MTRLIRSLVLVVALSGLALPVPADARAGGGHSSMGSRGSRTYAPSPSTAQPIQRSATPEPAPARPQSQPAYAPQSAPSYYPNQARPAGHPFLSGLAGGVAGMAIGHFLFGSQGMAMGMGGGGMGMGGMGGGMGTPGLLHILIIGGLIFLAFRVIRSMMGNGGMRSSLPFRNDNFAGMPMAQPALQARSVGQPIQLMDSDAAAFKQLFLDIQQAWSNNNFTKLQQNMTPEMLQYFNEELSANNSRGVTNKVENVQIQQIDPVESWHEYNLDYASVKLRWTANDYMVPIDASFAGGQQVASSPSVSQEQWTFMRSPGGRWLLSAIQQTN